MAAVPQEDLLTIVIDHPPGSERARVAVAGDVDVASVNELSAALEKVVADGATRVEIDLSQVPFMDSTGLTALIEASTKLHGRGAVVVVAHSPAVRRTLEVAGLEAFLRE